MKQLGYLSFLAILLAVFGFNPRHHEVVTIFMIGDSTMANKPNPATNPERGWGQLLPEFFDEERVVVENHGVNGRSTRSFIDEGRWDRVLEKLKPGDYVIIQFGHNDQKVMDPKRYTNPFTAYRNNLERFVRETRKKGGIPILASSIVRRHFNEYGTLEDSHGLYPWVARQVAQTLEVPFMDLQMRTEQLVERMGPEESKSLFVWVKPGEYAMYPEGREDNTHLNEAGARLVAQMAVEEMRILDLDIIRFSKKLSEKD